MGFKQITDTDSFEDSNSERVSHDLGDQGFNKLFKLGSFRTSVSNVVGLINVFFVDYRKIIIKLMVALTLLFALGSYLLPLGRIYQFMDQQGYAQERIATSKLSFKEQENVHYMNHQLGVLHAKQVVGLAHHEKRKDLAQLRKYEQVAYKIPMPERHYLLNKISARQQWFVKQVKK